MAFKKRFDMPTPVTTPPCIHLRSKAIYVLGELRNPEHPDEEGADYCWCNCTQHVLGPDDDDVSRSDCVPGRDCYRETR